MIIRKLEDILGTDRDVAWGNGRSRRFLIKADGVPYSLTDTIVSAGSKSLLEYRNHVETCYCISGKGSVRDVATGEEHTIVPGTMYALDRHDAHYLTADDEDLRLVCVFLPALRGNEVHNVSSGEHSSAYV
ncbi:ectoine synthase [Rhizobium mongolense]|uniref:L-ectoine synthase n=2 Tax=Rhizobium mongolense TaxID=57676 RepID=A0ABR6IYW1_9HYPH|nr:ectoine synthase [Rhizobium mongolense]MBB4233077.1 L-ectoine synthase [Rhizobium mongolense]TVZ74960.1 L-ectoine synthase [Rhizobium mongolense USDA 1844]